MSEAPHASVLETIGETPMVALQDAPDDVAVYAKLESFNPGASVKDRIGYYMLERLLERGEVPPGGTVIEPTAGNTGIGMAMAATQLDLDAMLLVPEDFSEEKQELMRALGAEVINTPTEEGMTYARERAEDLAAERADAIVPQQFSNSLNVEAHYETTAPELFEALDGEVGAIVAGCGTAGTLMGIARYATEQPEPPRIVAVEPEGSMYRAFHGEAPERGEYKVEGIGTRSPEMNELYEPDLVDDLKQVSDRAVHEECQRLAAEEGHLVGSSAAANSLAAKAVAAEISAGEVSVPHETVVTLFPDSSERYLSKGLYGDFGDWDD